MKKIIALVLSSVLCISAVGCSSKVNDNDVVATVNGNNITAKQFQATLALYKESLEVMYGSTIWDTEVEDGVKYKDKFKECNERGGQRRIVNKTIQSKDSGSHQSDQEPKTR